jgi:glycosyltransferase involved in cell wall biosynthesis
MSEAMVNFSVVVPLYNKEATVARALRSALNQTVQDFEIIVVNDGSADNGAAIVEAIDDSRIRLIHQKNQGVSVARNRGIAVARYELIAFLDADDEWLPGFLETIRRMIIRYPNCGLYATRYFLRSPSGQQQPAIIRGIPDTFEGILEDYFFVAAQSNPPVWTSATCVRKNVMMQIGGFPVGVIEGEDLLTWAKIAVKNAIAFSAGCFSIYWLSHSEIFAAPPIRIPAANDIVGSELDILMNEIAPSRRVSLRHYCALWHKMRASFYLRLGRKKEARQETLYALQYQFRFKLVIYLFFSILPPVITRKIFRFATF